MIPTAASTPDPELVLISADEEEANAAIYDTFASEARDHRDTLFRAFWIGVVVFVVFIIWKANAQSSLAAAAAWFVAFACVLPSYLWCKGASTGLPIFPLFSLMQLTTYSIPVLTGQPQLSRYSETQIVAALLTVGIFLLVSTLVWVPFTKETEFEGGSFRVLIEGRGLSVSYLPVLALDLLSVSEAAGWIPANASWNTLARGATLGLSTLSLFVLSYRLGARDLGKMESAVFLSMLALAVVASMTTLYLVSAMTHLLVTLIGFLIGRGRAPWGAVLLCGAVFMLLHLGKGDMRVKYWPKGLKPVAVTPIDYPGFYTEWVVDALKHSNSRNGMTEDTQPLWWRGSLLHLLLMVQEKTPNKVPYLNGATYAIIPELFVPRILNKNKIRSHEGTYMLAIRYGLQTLKDTNTTTIGFGLLNEAFANYGYMGCLGLAIIIGGGAGWITRWSQHAPLFSFRSLAAVVVLSYSMQSEFSAGVYAAALFQSIVSLGVVSLLIMKKRYYPAAFDHADPEVAPVKKRAKAGAVA